MVQNCGMLVLLICSLLSTSVAAGKEEVRMNGEESKVIELISKMTSEFQKGSIDGVLNSYESGASVMFEPGKQVSDPTVLKEMFKGAFTLNPKFSYPNGHEVYVSNDLALHIAPWVMAAEAPDGTAIEQIGLSVSVLRKQDNGHWLLVLDNPHGQILMDK